MIDEEHVMRVVGDAEQTSNREHPRRQVYRQFFFFKQKTAYELVSGDWSSDVCSSDLVDAAGRAIHIGWVCQGGTTCVATGQDRRLGDYFTNVLDGRGCVLIATGDTRLTDPTTGGPLPTARPLFIRQNGGPRLIGSGTCS